MTQFYDKLESRDPAERERDQLSACRAQVAHARGHTEAYRQLFSQLDDDNIDAVDFHNLPLTRKSELIDQQRLNPPLGGYLAVDRSSLRQLFASPGPIYEPGIDKPDAWRFARALHASGFRRGELIYNCFSYHLTPAGMMVEGGAHALGCSVVPAGVGQTDLQARTIADLSPDGYTGTPSFLKLIIDRAEQLSTNTSSLKRALVSGEALPNSLREDIQTRGIDVLQCYATADLGVLAYESSAREGLIIDEGIYLEIVRPGSADPVEDGEVGEVVVTSLSPEYPLIRFATGDLSAILPGQSPCGRTNKRIRGWLGRADQTAKIRGMFVHPEQVNRVVKYYPQILRARLVVDWIDQADQVVLQCEVANRDDSLIESIAAQFRDICKLRCEVNLATPDSLANDGKIIDDVRRYD